MNFRRFILHFEMRQMIKIKYYFQSSKRHRLFNTIKYYLNACSVQQKNKT